MTKSSCRHHEYRRGTFLTDLHIIQYFLRAGAAFAAAGAYPQFIAQAINGGNAAVHGFMNIAVGNVIADADNHRSAIREE